MNNRFPAMLARMNCITRWGLMRNARPESLAEHSLFTAYTAHYLACSAKNRFGADVDPSRVACAAMYHDAAEILTGDMPTPVKYGNDRLRAEYKKVEAAAEQRLLDMLPADLRQEYEPLVTGGALSERENAIIKAADKLSALVKCTEELASGGGDFRSAYQTTLTGLQESTLPEVRAFLDECIPSFRLTLDELLQEDCD